MSKDTEKVLKKYGLSENEIKVYTEALKLDETSPYELSKLTGIPRTTVYDVITDLSLKDLLELEKSDGYTKQQTKIKAKNPSILRENLRKRHDELQDLEVDLVSILPILKGSYQKGDSNSDFEYFNGIEGALKIYRLEAEISSEIDTFVFTYLMPMDTFGTKEINLDVDKETKLRKKSGKKVHELIPLNKWTKHILSYQLERNPEYLSVRNYRYIENPIFELYQRFAIAGNQIFIICTNEDESWGLRIKSKSLAKSFKSMFDLLWITSTEVTEDIVKSWGENAYGKSERAKQKVSKNNS